VPNCCYADEYGEVFTTKSSSRDARNYLKGGLGGSEAVLADRVNAIGIEGATILEVGGGVGALSVELLKRGAASAVNVDLTNVWQPQAESLAVAAGVSDRSRFQVGDLVDEAEALPEADIVLLHRVVCCYPDWERMIDAAAGRARRGIGLTIPRSTWLTRLFIFTANRFEQFRGRSFRAFIHPADELLARLDSQGFNVASDDHDLVWRTLVLVRRPA
jgi:magnesium-protoporphyrin O-methyltransferase